MNDLLLTTSGVVFYLGAAIAGLGIVALLYTLHERNWVSLDKEEIYKLWDANADKFGSVEEFVRAVEKAIQEKNP